MSDLRVGSVGDQQTLPIPLIPDRSHQIYEGIPTDPNRSHGMGEVIPHLISIRDEMGSPGTGTGQSGPSKSLPEWLRRLLVNLGTLSENGLGRAARLRSCRTCHLLSVAGLDADVAALEAHCDPAPLSPIGEVLALRDGRRTYALWTAGRRQELEPRTRYSIRGYPAGTPRRPPVLAGHVCGQPVPGAWCAPLEPAPEPTGGDEW